MDIRQRKRIVGRLLEGLGIGISGGTVVSFIMVEWKFWYFIIVSAFLIGVGIKLQEDNK